MAHFSAADHTYMAQALRLAEQGLYTSMPNPRVGCVIVNDGVVVGEGAHLIAGEPHAEVLALRQAGEKAQGATVYVTLEPCNHHGRTPPCAGALVQAKVAKVIAAMQDPNPLVSGTGLAHLQSQGVETDSGLMQTQAEALNPGFAARMTKLSPFVRSKIAASLDGKTALSNGESQWITSEAARLDVQHWRARSCAIMTGVGTVLADNPSLTVRALEIGRQPLRVIVDSQLRTPLHSKVLQGGHTLIAFAVDANHRAAQFYKTGTALICLPDAQGKVCLKTLLSHLASNEINEVLVEGGQGLNGALMAQKLIDELIIYYAPKLMGGAANNMFALPPFTSMQQAISLDLLDLRQLGSDIRLRAKLTLPC
ncbi:MAG: bifunctional diaminohydroxyphosphoribosylaminopyrimidine deaminase/5-amino-6-(5-phosphoribosylamino)uracil reductase RibD [Methylophilaceae bacterium]